MLISGIKNFKFPVDILVQKTGFLTKQYHEILFCSQVQKIYHEGGKKNNKSVEGRNHRFIPDLESSSAYPPFLLSFFPCCINDLLKPRGPYSSITNRQLNMSISHKTSSVNNTENKREENG